MYRCLPLFILAFTYPTVAQADEQDEAIAHVVNLKGTIVRDETKASRPVVAVSLAHIKGFGKELGIKKLTAFPELKRLDLAYTGVTDGNIQDIQHLKSLVELDLTNTNPNDITSGILAESKIEVLYLSGAYVSDPFLKDLGKMKSLKSVTLSDNKHITAAGLGHLATAPSLESVTLNKTPTDDEGLKQLSGAKKLKKLHLTETKVTDAGIKHLAGCQSLGDLDLMKTEVTEKGLKELIGLKLTRLTMGGKQLIDVDISPIEKFPDLEFLWIEEASITAAGIKHLAGLTKLTELRLGRNTRLGDDCMKTVAALPEVKKLYLYGCKITPVGLAELAAAKKLDFLTTPEQIDDSSLLALSKAGKLHTLYIFHKTTTFTDISENRPQSLAEVGMISIDGGEKITNVGFKEFAGCKNLKALSIYKVGIDAEAMKVVAGFADLEQFDIQLTPIGDAGLKAITGLAKLKSFFASECKITEAGLNEFQKALPNLKIEK